MKVKGIFPDNCFKVLRRCGLVNCLNCRMRFKRIVYTNPRPHLPNQGFPNMAFSGNLIIGELAPLLVLKHDPDGISLVRVRPSKSVLVVLAQ